MDNHCKGAGPRFSAPVRTARIPAKTHLSGMRPAGGKRRGWFMLNMSEPQFALDLAERLVARVHAVIRFSERQGPRDEPFMLMKSIADGSPAGWLRLWAAEDESLADRFVHLRITSAPVDTHLLFLFGRADTAMPHFHGQVVQFGPDACVYNADIIPRLDAVDHPGYFREVYGPVTRAYWKVATDPKNVCSMAPANPAIAVYLSPWSIAAGRPTTRAELDRVTPGIEAYLDRCLALARELAYPAPPAAQMRERDRRHLDILHSDELDPRAWKGVYRILGEQVGHRVKQVLATPLR